LLESTEWDFGEVEKDEDEILIGLIEDGILLESTEWNFGRSCKGWGSNSEVEILTKFLKCKSREGERERISSNKLEKEKGILID
jgi:hypothetical protein